MGIFRANDVISSSVTASAKMSCSELTERSSKGRTAKAPTLVRAFPRPEESGFTQTITTRPMVRNMAIAHQFCNVHLGGSFSFEKSRGDGDYSTRHRPQT